MNAYHLKILACIFMVIDHIGVLFFPQSVFFRIIGRASFPIFAFFLGEGAKHTRNTNKYLLTILGFALISEPVYKLALNGSGHNIFLTLFVGLLGVLIYKKLENKKIAISLIAILAIIAEVLKFEYGFYGVSFIALLSIFHPKEHMSELIKGTIFILILSSIVTYLHYPTSNIIGIINPLQYFSIYAFWLILTYNGSRGPTHKYAFYIFYPLHLLLLYIIKVLI